MNKIFNKKNAIFSLLKSILLIIAYLIFLYSPLKDTEFVRGFCEDFAFDILNILFLSTREVNVKNAPHLIVFKVDKEYEKYKKEENSSYSVGYIFPRSNIAEFITSIDNLPKDKQPKALFIDYNFDYTSKPDGKSMDKSDKKLLEVLKKRRKYTIYLPLSPLSNEKDKPICKDGFLSKNGHFKYETNSSNSVKFVSVGELVSSDDIVRRYISCCEINNTKIPHIALKLSDIKPPKNCLVKNRVVNTRIIFKDKKTNNVIKSDYRESYWKNVEFYSAKRLIDKDKIDLNLIINDKNYNPNNSIFIIGSFSPQSKDKFQVAKLFNSTNVYGTEVLANTIMTTAYLQNFLKVIPWYYILPIIFIIFFIFDYIVSLIFDMFNIYSFVIESFISFAIISIIFLFLSYLIFINFHLWFNWFLPSLMTEIVETIVEAIDFLGLVSKKIRRRKSHV